jgi:hypothetical protein
LHEIVIKAINIIFVGLVKKKSCNAKSYQGSFARYRYKEDGACAGPWKIIIDYDLY